MRHIARLTVIACTLLLGAVACTPAEQDRAAAKASAAGDDIENAAREAGAVIEVGAAKAARAVEEGAGAVATKLEQNQDETREEGDVADRTPAS